MGMDKVGGKGAQRKKYISGSKVNLSLQHNTLSLPKDAGLFSYTLPSHEETLFAGLRSLQEEKLLLDCVFPLRGGSIQAHRLVLAATSQTPDAYFASKQIFGLGVEENACCLTSVGLRAVLDFAYCGDVAVNLNKNGAMEEVLNACRCLKMERLRQKCMSNIATPAATEREKSLAAIKDMWERGVGCDVIIQAETGERYPGKTEEVTLILVICSADQNRKECCYRMIEALQ